METAGRCWWGRGIWGGPAPSWVLVALPRRKHSPASELAVSCPYVGGKFTGPGGTLGRGLEKRARPVEQGGKLLSDAQPCLVTYVFLR